MPNLRELRSRIKSIESTSRVTKALQMIAAAKMKKAQDKVLDGRSYSEKLNAIIGNVYQSNPEIFSLNSEDGSNKNLVLIVTPDRGLCGALVSNVLKETSKFIDSILLSRQLTQLFLIIFLIIACSNNHISCTLVWIMK